MGKKRQIAKWTFLRYLPGSKGKTAKARRTYLVVEVLCELMPRSLRGDWNSSFQVIGSDLVNHVDMQEQTSWHLHFTHLLKQPWTAMLLLAVEKWDSSLISKAEHIILWLVSNSFAGFSALNCSKSRSYLLPGDQEVVFARVCKRLPNKSWLPVQVCLV